MNRISAAPSISRAHGLSIYRVPSQLFRFPISGFPISPPPAVLRPPLPISALPAHSSPLLSVSAFQRLSSLPLLAPPSALRFPALPKFPLSGPQNSEENQSTCRRNCFRHQGRQRLQEPGNPSTPGCSPPSFTLFDPRPRPEREGRSTTFSISRPPARRSTGCSGPSAFGNPPNASCASATTAQTGSALPGLPCRMMSKEYRGRLDQPTHSPCSAFLLPGRTGCHPVGRWTVCPMPGPNRQTPSSELPNSPNSHSFQRFGFQSSALSA
jgi:hypothetical protein